MKNNYQRVTINVLSARLTWSSYRVTCFRCLSSHVNFLLDDWL